MNRDSTPGGYRMGASHAMAAERAVLKAAGVIDLTRRVLLA
jgi:hypothetical protein